MRMKVYGCINEQGIDFTCRFNICKSMPDERDHSFYQTMLHHERATCLHFALPFFHRHSNYIIRELTVKPFNFSTSTLNMLSKYEP